MTQELSGNKEQWVSVETPPELATDSFYFSEVIWALVGKKKYKAIYRPNDKKYFKWTFTGGEINPTHWKPITS